MVSRESWMKQLATRPGCPNGSAKKVRGKVAVADAGSVIWCNQHQAIFHCISWQVWGRKGSQLFEVVWEGNPVTHAYAVACFDVFPCFGVDRMLYS